MPGALNLPWAGVVVEDGTLKHAERLRAVFEAAGVDLERPIVTTCGSGVSAAIPGAGAGACWPRGRPGLRRLMDGVGRGRPARRSRRDHDLRTRTGKGDSDSTRLLRAGKAAGRAAADGRAADPEGLDGADRARPPTLYDDRRPTYGRAGLAAHEALAEALASLEGASTVALFPSGLGAVAGAMLAVLKAGDEVLVTDAVYSRPAASATGCWAASA